MKLPRRIIAAALSLSLLLAGCAAAPAQQTETTRTQTATAQAAVYERGPGLSATVYVSKSGHKIHRKANCSGMKNYWTMTYGEALDHGYTECANCF